MTHRTKKARKHVKKHRARSAFRGRAPWLAMGAFVASAAMSGRLVTPVEAKGMDEARPDPVSHTSLLALRRVEALADPLYARPRVLPLTTHSGLFLSSDALRSARTDAWIAQAPSTQRFDIPPGPLDTVLVAFKDATGITVLVSTDSIRTLHSNGVSGTYTLEQALEQLLTGTGLTHRFTSPQSVSLELRIQSEFVEVSGRAPVVASPKYTEPLRDVPQTINVISSEVIEQQAATTLRDVLRNVAGITFQAGEGGVPAGDQLTIRGFSARTDIFIDGVRDFGGYSRDSFNLEQVEVTKGPSSITAGRGSTGGSINLVSKSPRLAASHDGTLSLGNADYKRTTIDLNQPLEGLGQGTAFRLNAMWNDQGFPGRDVVESNRWGVAPSIAFGLNTPTRVTVSYLHLAQDNLPEYGLPWVPANTNPELEAYSNGQPPVDSSNFYGLESRDYEDTVSGFGTALVEHDFSTAFSLRNITRYGKTTRDSVITAPRFASVNTSTAINRQLQSRDMTDDIVANQTNLTGRFRTGALQHAVVAGLEVARETSENFLRTGPTAPQADLYHPNPDDAYPGPITRTGAVNEGSARSAAVYAFDTLNLTEQWELSGGLRWDRFDVDYSSTAATGEVTPLERTDNMTSFRGGIVYKPRPNGSIYFGAGTSFNPSAEGLSLSAATVNLDPEKTRSYELGTKWDVVNQRLSLTTALFRTEKTNARTPGLNPGDPPTVLQGEQTVDGIELGVSGRIGARWTALGGYTYMRSNIEASNTPTELDNALALTPEHTLNFWTTYEFPWRLTIGGGAQYMDSVFRNATNTATVPSYWLINSLVSYDVNTHLSLRFNANNLADEKYVDRVGGGHYIPGAGRSLMLSTNVRF